MSDPFTDEPNIVNFGNLSPIPSGWCVMWHPNLDHYVGHGPNEWESLMCWDRYRVRIWVIEAAAEVES